MTPANLDDLSHDGLQRVAGTSQPIDVDRVIGAVYRRMARRRRRRLLTGAAVVGVVIMCGALLVGRFVQDDEQRVQVNSGTSGSDGQIDALVLWIGWREGPTLADPNTGTTTAIGPTDKSGDWCQTCPLVRIGDRVFTAQHRRLYMYEPQATALQDIGPGDTVFPAADGKSILVKVDAQLVQRTLDGASTGGPWPIPEGYNLTSPARATAAGVLVETTANAFIRQLAEWQPATGEVRAVGPYNNLIDAYTAPSGSSTVVARTDCDNDFPCWLLLTDTATGHVTRVDSPIPGNGFYGGGAFSPDGSQLAVFVATNTGTTNPAAKLAVVDVATGQLRLIDGSETPVGEPYGYASWSPSGGWVFFGGLSGGLHVLRRGRTEAQALRLAGSYSLVALDRSTGEPAPAS